PEYGYYDDVATLLFFPLFQLKHETCCISIKTRNDFNICWPWTLQINEGSEANNGSH
ncbi:hypothetical protein L9F63_008337, partial [Diploptera punctata]